MDRIHLVTLGCSLMLFRMTVATWKDCGSTGVSITDVYVPGCESSTCQLKRGNNASISISFIPAQELSAITNKVYGVIYSASVYFPLPQADGCKLGVSCPMNAGEQYTETVTLYVSPYYPAIQLVVRWELDDSSKNQVGCFKIPLQLV
ncbi:hypothetical protein EMCRGX_G032466 [Ephydatia muelleri]|eukprot:Em0019g233a